MTPKHTSYAIRVRALHDQAQGYAANAIECAIEVGRLLTNVKVSVPHGEFGRWVQDQCGFAERTARRYMRLHRHRNLLPAGAGIVAALEHVKTVTVAEMKWPSWLPDEGLAVTATDHAGRTWYAWEVEGMEGFANALAITKTHRADDGVLVQGLPRGIRTDYLPQALQSLGLSNQSSAQWETCTSEPAAAWLYALTEEGAVNEA